MIITEELLKKEGWIKTTDNIIQSQEPDYFSYELEVEDTNRDKFYVDMRYALSNSPDRDWSCFIDNDYREGVACVDIQTTDHFNALMNIFGISYRMPC